MPCQDSASAAVSGSPHSALCMADPDHHQKQCGQTTGGSHVPCAAGDRQPATCYRLTQAAWLPHKTLPERSGHDCEYQVDAVPHEYALANIGCMCSISLASYDRSSRPAYAHLGLKVTGIYTRPQRCAHATAATTASMDVPGNKVPQAHAPFPRAQEEIHGHHRVRQQHQSRQPSACLGHAPLQTLSYTGHPRPSVHAHRYIAFLKLV